MKKIAAVIAIHGRESITLKTVLRLKQQTYPVSHVILVGETPMEKKIAEVTKSIFVPHVNKPLGAKWQAGIYKARELGVDAILIIGSDDWLTDNWVEAMMFYGERGFHLIGKNSMYFMHVSESEKKLLKWNGYITPVERQGEPIGAGRIFMRNILDAMDWRLFPDYIDGGLDKSSYFFTLGYHGSVKLVEDESVMALDIKSTFWSNKWDYEGIQKLEGVEHINDPDAFLDKNFPDANEWFEILRQNEAN